jgi:hypothetical protein
MKKTYTTPALVISGDAVQETRLAGSNPVGESEFTKSISSGAVGFYL